MGDFHQTEVISTLHRLRKDNVEKLEEDLREHSTHRPISLDIAVVARFANDHD